MAASWDRFWDWWKEKEAMTTQAQIEAARKMLQLSSCFGKEVCPILPCACAETMAALTAAAEVGEPSDSKIATVAKAIKEAHECYGNEYTTMACAAIAAADPALRDFIADTPYSEPNDGWAVPSIYKAARATYGDPHVDIIVKNAIAATIERCAQVADKYADENRGTYGCGPYTRTTLLATAAAIRALKERA